MQPPGEQSETLSSFGQPVGSKLPPYPGVLGKVGCIGVPAGKTGITSQRSSSLQRLAICSLPQRPQRPQRKRIMAYDDKWTSRRMQEGHRKTMIFGRDRGESSSDGCEL